MTTLNTALDVMTIKKNKALAAYIARVRNLQKKEYARAVVAYGPDSAQALNKHGTLSYMARQAVRMCVADIEAAS